MTDREVRYLRTDLELRRDKGVHLPVIYGYSAKFNVESDNLGGFRERLQPGSFTRTLGERPDAIKAFHNHNQDIVIGSTRKGTLELHEDEAGLAHRIEPPDNEWGRPVIDAIERGDVEGMSFGFALASSLPEHDPNNEAVQWEESSDGLPLRDVREVRLYEVSTISGWPAYPQTSTAVRALADAIHVEDTDLRSAFAVLVAEEGELTTEQHEMLMLAITSRTSAPFIRPSIAEAQATMLRRARELGMDA